MKRTLYAAAALMAIAAPVFAQSPVRARETECRGWGDRERYCEVREYVLAAPGAIQVDAGRNGGIQVVGWDRNDVLVLARIQTNGDDDAAARAIAAGIDVRVGQVIRADGPRSRRSNREGWSVSYEIHVPRATRLALEASNGGIRLEGLSGDVEASTTNGGISVIGGAGRVRGETTNGGLQLDLTGGSWSGDGVDLRTTNGGVTIRVPEGYSARLETGTVNGGMDLDFPVTVEGRVNRTIRTTLGEGGPLIRAMTTNGGVSLKRN